MHGVRAVVRALLTQVERETLGLLRVFETLQPTPTTHLLQGHTSSNKDTPPNLSIHFKQFHSL